MVKRFKCQVTVIKIIIIIIDCIKMLASLWKQYRCVTFNQGEYFKKKLLSLLWSYRSWDDILLSDVSMRCPSFIYKRSQSNHLIHSLTHLLALTTIKNAPNFKY